MKVSEYVAEFISRISPRVYGVCGAGAMHLNDAIANHPGIQVIAMQHEQAAAMAAEADARVTGNISVVSVTTGPGGTNAMTGVACAYVDSIPMLIIAGQVTSSTMIGALSFAAQSVRQVGMNELSVFEMMCPITKYATTVLHPSDLRSALEEAFCKANSGRKGPVFVEIPLDVQAMEIDDVPPVLRFDNHRLVGISRLAKETKEEFAKSLREAKRPLVIVGNGVRLAGAEQRFLDVFGGAGIPIVSSWGAADIIPTDHPYYIGRCGIFGDRASNFAVQSADFILILGSRLSVAMTGHSPCLFAPKAKKIIIDIDEQEIFKLHDLGVLAPSDIGIAADVGSFLDYLTLPPLRTLPWIDGETLWMRRCQEMKKKYPSRGFNSGVYGIGSYEFVDRLSDELADDAVVVTDVGFCFIPTFQTLRLRTGQRLIHSAGVSPMGWGLPAAIGAAFAAPKRQIICLTGDGGLMLNLQELQTIATHRLPIAIFVFENGGYATMKIAQNNHFKREVMSGDQSGLSLPNFVKIGKAFGIVTKEFGGKGPLSHDLPTILDIAAQAPIIVVMHMDRGELIAPRLQARMQDGKFVPVDLADMWPHLDRQEVEANLKGVSDVVSDGQGSKILAAN